MMVWFCLKYFFESMKYDLKNSKHYPGIEPSTFGVTVGNPNHCAIQTAVTKLNLKISISFLLPARYLIN
jgi:hypothetical protein